MTCHANPSSMNSMAVGWRVVGWEAGLHKHTGHLWYSKRNLKCFDHIAGQWQAGCWRPCTSNPRVVAAPRSWTGGSLLTLTFERAQSGNVVGASRTSRRILLATLPRRLTVSRQQWDVLYLMTCSFLQHSRRTNLEGQCALACNLRRWSGYTRKDHSGQLIATHKPRFRMNKSSGLHDLD
jgi:hypothetical protein